MAALVQTYTPQTATVAMLHTRPNSASGMLQSHQGQQYHQPQGGSQSRNSYHGGLQGGMGGPVVYRGSVGPVQPYAFTSTPSLNQTVQWQPPAAYHRTSSTSAVPTMHSFDHSHNGGRSRYLTSASMTNLPTTSTLGLSMGGSRDDSSIPGTATRRTATSFTPPQGQPAKPSPERYRRPAPRAADASTSTQHGNGQQQQVSVAPSGSGMPSVNHLYNQRSEQQRRNSFVGAIPGSMADEGVQPTGAFSAADAARRVRRRSLPTLDSAEFPKPLTPLQIDLSGIKQPEESNRLERPLSSPRPKSAGKEYQQKPARPVNLTANDAAAVQRTKAAHGRTGSSDSRASSRSSNSRPSSSANRSNTNVSAPTGNPALFASSDPGSVQNSSNPDYPRLVNIPPRSSSSDAATTKRAANPSPLSKPVRMDAEVEVLSSPSAGAAGGAVGAAHQGSAPQAAKMESAAVKQLSAINEKGGKSKSKTSRLRRAFSFSSAAELRKAAGGDFDAAQGTGHAKLQKAPTPEEMYDAEQARIAQRQEAAGIGSNIYSGGKIFTSSTDNISISSTASSASIMIRKMGHSMKKGGRSLVGLFRPKSIIGVPAADSKSPEPSEAAVSMITVEAERERINVNADLHSQNGGGTGFPHLERNSIDASKAASSSSERQGSSGTDSTAPRKSIVGGEKERAEVLAAVRKGILKRSPSPSPKPEGRGPAFDLPAQMTDSPISSVPSTPNDEAQGHRRTGSVAIGNEDYFMSALRLRQDTKSAPGTPQGHKRNATFSPRIMFYDTWPSGEYDRRGEIATCNRLTPMLAQQIKEELNTFKMEMEVHENSKIYTHFF
ncbi:hypothetical protein BR93DRAFT_992909 [Coniochaeta sp. PMI_546]|nr:hypothetical protein BR93DRAFT_992909 [Coniochaeta sp. PMI_546]